MDYNFDNVSLLANKPSVYKHKNSHFSEKKFFKIIKLGIIFE